MAYDHTRIPSLKRRGLSKIQREIILLAGVVLLLIWFFLGSVATLRLLVVTLFGAVTLGIGYWSFRIYRNYKHRSFKIAPPIERVFAFGELPERTQLGLYLRQMDPREFELLICRFYREQGYTVESTPYEGDHGVDAYLFKGKEKIVVQCKRYKNQVGEAAIRDLWGVFHHYGATRAIIVTTGFVSRQARHWAADKQIDIIELSKLIDLLSNHFMRSQLLPVDFAPSTPAREICPSCRMPLFERNGKKGWFAACSGFPLCRFTESR